MSEALRADSRSSPPAVGDALRPYVSALHAECLRGGSSASCRVVEGSLLFADVSGFTPLTERLSRGGKVGAEQLTETLNVVFSALLDVAEHLGGDCLKFGGDALLLLFQGADHQRRAAAAAAGMQQALRLLRRSGGSTGLAGLGISMGAHSGTFHAFVVGSSHRELLVAGPVVNRTLELEGRAERGQILLGEPTAAALDPGATEALGDGAFLLRRSPDVPGGDRPAMSGAHLDVTDAVPAPLRRHLDGHRNHGEHRLAAVGFLKYGGVEALLRDEGPESAACALDSLISLAQSTCEDLDITFIASDVDVDGGKLILAGGVPAAGDDDGDRLLVALHRVVEAARDLPVRLRAGATSGRIFAVDLGSDGRRTFTVMGDAVNLAARVMGHAEWGEVLATDAALERSRIDFRLARLEPFRVKGKSAPVHAQRVEAAVGARGARLGAGPLVGRTADVQALLDALAASRAGEGRIVELVGEAGIGKSRLVATACADAADLRQLSVQAGRYSSVTPYHAVRNGLRAALGAAPDASTAEVHEALARLVARRAPDLEQWLPLLGVPVGLELADSEATARLDTALRQTALHHAWAELLARTLDRPTLVLIEDAHWLDAASCGLLLALLGQLAERPWAVIVTRRAGEGGLTLPDRPELVRRELEPLDRDDLFALAAATAGTTLPPGVVSQLVDRSGGNPLFLHELVTAWSSDPRAELPETIEAVVGSQIDTLAADDRALLRHAAVLGMELRPEVLAAVVDAPPAQIAAALGRLHHFLHDTGHGSVRFSHALLQDVAYEGLPYRTRQRMHERAGEILEASARSPEAIAELLSIHFERAGRWGPAWRYSLVAAERAQRNGASIEAAGFYDRALAVAERLEDLSVEARADVAEALGDNCELSGRYERASAAYRRARTLGVDPIREARLCRKLGFVRDHEGRYGAAQRWFRRALAALDGVGDVPLQQAQRAEILTAMVSSRYRQGRHARAVPLIQEAIASAEASGASAALAHAYFVYDELLIDRGRYHEAGHSHLAAAIYEELGDHRGAAAAYNEMGVTAYWLGRWDEAVGCYERAMASDRKAGAIVYNAIYLNNIGEIRSDQGRLDEAEQLLTGACDLWTSGGWRAGTGWALSNLGRLAARDGRMEEARARFDEARVVLRDIGAEGMLLETDARSMERCVLLGDHRGALDLAEELAERAHRLGFDGVSSFVQRLEGYARCQAGERDGVIGKLEESLAGSLARGARYEAALADEALARVGEVLAVDPEAQALHRRRAEEVLAQLGVVRTPSVPLPAAPTTAAR